VQALLPCPVACGAWCWPGLDRAKSSGRWAGGVLLPLLVLLATILTRCNASTVRELVDRHQPLAVVGVLTLHRPKWGGIRASLGAHLGAHLRKCRIAFSILPMKTILSAVPAPET